MQLLIKKARIVAPASDYHLQLKDIFIRDGIIVRIADNITEAADQIFEQQNLHVSPGWIDVFANFCDPGQEYKEDLQSGCKAAAAGGFTGVMIIPNTQPPLQSKSEMEYVQNKTAHQPVNIFPIGALSKNLEGKALAEMYEMQQSGAVAFSDGIKPVQSSGLLLKALQYVKSFHGIIIQVPDDTSISHNGLMNEGIYSTRLGMPGKPAIAEEILIRRDLELAQYAGSQIHFTGISTKGAVDLIRAAKAQGISVSCSVTPYHLCLKDEDIAGYNTFLKVNPPLRTQEDIEALKQAVKDGVIDCIATHHLPQDWDSKEKEFEYAKEGMTGLQTCFSVINIALPDLDITQKINLFSTQPRNIFHLPPAIIKEGEKANLTIFNPDIKWIFEEKNIFSKSKNSPFIGKELKGKALGIINRNHFIFTNREE